MYTERNNDEIDRLVQEAVSSKLYVYNDDVNSFIMIMALFVRTLGHSFEQAEQCATIIHNVGKCCVKLAPYDELYKIKELYDKLNVKSEIVK